MVADQLIICPVQSLSDRLFTNSKSEQFIFFFSKTLAQFKKLLYLCPRNWVIGFVCSFLFVPVLRRTNNVHIDKSVYWRFEFWQIEKLRNFFITKSESKWAMDAYGYGVYHIASAFVGVLYHHISVGFPVVYLTWWVMRRPRFVNKQLEVCAFCMCLCYNGYDYLSNKQPY